MRIGIDARPAAADITGVGVCIIHLVRHLVNHNGIECVLFYDEQPAYEITTNPKAKKVVLQSKRRLYWEQVLLPYGLRQNGIHLYHATWNYGIPLSCPCPAVVTIHDVIPLAMPDYSTPLKAKLIYQFSLRVSVWKAKAIIADSQASKNDVIELLKITPDKIGVIHNGISQVYRPVNSQNKIKSARSRYGITFDYIIYIGGLDPRKNIDGLMKAFKLFRDKVNDKIQLVVIGRKNYFYSTLLGLAEDLGLSEYVIFTGYIPDGDMPVLLSGSKMLVYPSFYEGFGFPPLEAMACGTPVITSNRSSMPEVVGSAAILINPDSTEEIADTMYKVYADETLVADLEKKGLTRARQFSWEKMASETLSVYKKVLKI